jgi:hypothetical protein
MKLSNLLRLAALHLDNAPPEEVEKVVKYMATQVSKLSDQDVCYAFYVSVGVVDHPFVKWVGPIKSKLASEYQKRMVKWFKYALFNRAGRGGSRNPAIKGIESGIQSFVEDIPQAIESGATLDLAKYIPKNDFLNGERMTPVGNKILRVVREDAEKDGVLDAVTMRAAKTGLTVKWDPKAKLWKIPMTDKTRQMRPRDYGFEWTGRQWVTETLNPMIKRDFDIDPPPGKVVADWFWKKWYPKNSIRFTKVFTDFAMKAHEKYGIAFKAKKSKNLVKFKRMITSLEDVVEELRLWYLDKHGREPWLKTLDLFLDFQKTPPTATKRLISQIDLLNGMQHSNGLFMEHFPPNVAKWYKGFLNAKFASPDPEDLARYIKDRDFKDLMMYLAPAGKARPMGRDYWQEEQPIWHTQEKDIDIEGPDWRKKNYPRKKGTKPRKREDPAVQKGLSPIRPQDPYLRELWEQRSQ